MHGLGVRYRLHRKGLPGKPDLSNAARKWAIFMHGCFWHGHSCKRGARIPKENREYWQQKIGGNIARDARHLAEYDAMGWRVLVVWECELKAETQLTARLAAFLAADKSLTKLL
ncbi:putative DNA G:T-mismatch repair endonuclease [Magnetofaba australis IT-1]|uniref:Putative DNA G:T-mismatch repair endonuclease n=1 Tax=Magnetofaba australis IT-1 TaxID=1434232 RepID=A0A1Y2K8N7_9PROT|nr:putative DNA G:T-mismatch repair endonuclease [Magnetofaba australis IT-1]